jgi:hypothetical protein
MVRRGEGWGNDGYKLYFFLFYNKAYYYKRYLEFKEQQSLKLYEKRLKLKVFNAMLSNHKIESKIKENEIKALNFNNYWIEKHSLIKLKDRFEEKEDIKLMHLFYKGRKFHENFILKSSFTKWNLKYQKTIEFNVSFSLTQPEIVYFG